MAKKIVKLKLLAEKYTEEKHCSNLDSLPAYLLFVLNILFYYLFEAHLDSAQCSLHYCKYTVKTSHVILLFKSIKFKFRARMIYAAARAYTSCQMEEVRKGF